MFRRDFLRSRIACKPASLCSILSLGSMFIFLYEEPRCCGYSCRCCLVFRSIRLWKESMVSYCEARTITSNSIFFFNRFFQHRCSRCAVRRCRSWWAFSRRHSRRCFVCHSMKFSSSTLITTSLFFRQVKILFSFCLVVVVDDEVM